MEEALKGSERRVRSSYLEAPARRVQMIFQLKGAKTDGMVSLEAYKRSGAPHQSRRGVHLDLWFTLLAARRDRIRDEVIPP